LLRLSSVLLLPLLLLLLLPPFRCGEELGFPPAVDEELPPLPRDPEGGGVAVAKPRRSLSGEVPTEEADRLRLGFKSLR
jgi:hypothetical protein